MYVSTLSRVHYASLNQTQLALLVFSQYSAAVVRRKANDGIVYATRAWFKYDTALSAVVKARIAYSLIHCSSAVSFTYTRIIHSRQ